MLNRLVEQFAKVGITCYYVGGYVRDLYMGIKSDDIDICLIGVKDKSVVKEILSPYSVTEEVGKSFPVWIANVGGNKIDFAMARTELKTGTKHSEFECSVDDVSIEDDLRRRDLTINSIAINVLTGDVIDPYGGISDIGNKIARHTSSAFTEDSERVYRAARFIACFDLTPSDDLVELCKSMNADSISTERVGKELYKLFNSKCIPSKFFMFLKTVGWLDYHFTELLELDGVPQSKEHHPEGDAFVHTMHTLDQATTVLHRTAMLCHDLGKATTTKYIDGRVTAHNHELEGVPLTYSMLQRIVFMDKRFQNKVATLVELHMMRIHVSEKSVRQSLRKLMKVGLTFDDLIEVSRCDVSGRPPIAGYTPDMGQDIVKRILDNDEMNPIVTSDKLLQVGISSGPTMGFLIRRGLELQDRGTLNENNWFNVLKGDTLVKNQGIKLRKL